MTLEKRVSLGLLYTDQNVIRNSIENKMLLFKSSYAYLINTKRINETFNSLSNFKLEKLERSKEMNKQHDRWNNFITLIANKYNYYDKNCSYMELAVLLDAHLSNLIKKVHADLELVVFQCTPEWVSHFKKLEVPQHTKQEKNLKVKQIEKLEEVEKKEYKKGIVWFCIDPVFLPIERDSKENPILGTCKLENVQFPTGTILADLFPDMFIKRVVYSNQLQNRIDIETKIKLEKIKHKQEIAAFKNRIAANNE